MFGRVAACCIAAFVLISPVASSGETGSSFDIEAPKAIAPVTPTPNPMTPEAATVNATLSDLARDRSDAVSEERSNIRSADQSAEPIVDQVHADSTAQTKTASLDPEEPARKLDPLPAPVISPGATQPFGLAAEPLTFGDVLTKWSGVEADIRAERVVLAHCRDKTAPCPREARRFLDIVAAGRAQTGRARFGVINRAINLAIRPMSDLQQWGVEDRWTSPLATLATGLGDCEDYAIAKYVALTEAGVAREDVRLVIVRDPVIGEDHAVVTARLDGKWIVLDNRWLRMVEDSEMARIIPLVELDDRGVKMFLRDMPPVARAASAPAALRF